MIATPKYHGHEPRDRAEEGYDVIVRRLAWVTVCLLALFWTLWLFHITWYELGIRETATWSPAARWGIANTWTAPDPPVWVPDLLPDEWANISLMVASGLALLLAIGAVAVRRWAVPLLLTAGVAVLTVPILQALMIQRGSLGQGIALAVAVLALPATTIAPMVCPDLRLARLVPRVIAALFFAVLAWQLTDSLVTGGFARVQHTIVWILKHRPKPDLLGLGLMQLAALLALFAPLPLGKAWSARAIVWLSVIAFGLMTATQAGMLHIWSSANLNPVDAATLTGLWFTGMASVLFAAIAVPFARLVLARHQQQAIVGFRANVSGHPAFAHEHGAADAPAVAHVDAPFEDPLEVNQANKVDKENNTDRSGPAEPSTSADS